MSKVTQSLGFGKVSFPTTSASFTCQKVTAPFVRVSGVTSGKTSFGAGQEFLAGKVAEQGLIWVRPVEHDTGTIIMLQSGWRHRNAPVRDGAVFLRLRAEAAAWRIYYRIPTDAANTIGDKALAFEGRADILGLAELQGYGIEVPAQYRNKFMNSDEVDECFIIERTAAQVSTRPQLVTVGEGENARTIEVAAPPRRRLVFRRPG